MHQFLNVSINRLAGVVQLHFVGEGDPTIRLALDEAERLERNLSEAISFPPGTLRGTEIY